MLKHRLIPVLLLKGGHLVRSQGFKLHQIIGNPIHEIQRFNDWSVDEIIYIDIGRDDSYDLRRDDARISGLTGVSDIFRTVSEHCFVPLTWGGRIRTIADMRERFLLAADKITINTAAVETPELISQAAKTFGSQAIVVNIDVRRDAEGRATVFIDGGRTDTGLSPEDWARRVEDLGAGEILLQSIDRDGEATGYDLKLIHGVAAVTSIPIIALGGVGDYRHFAQGIEAGASAVAAANIWHFKEHADRGGKRSMDKAGIAIRPHI